MNLQVRFKNKFFKPIAWGLVAVLVLFLSAGTSLSRENPDKFKKAMPPEFPLPADSLDKQTGLIVAPGYVLVKENCIRCHSPKIITDKRATRDGWLATIRWMQQTQGLGNLGEAEPEILDYLATHYAPTYEGRRPPLKNIDWYKLK